MATVDDEKYGWGIVGSGAGVDSKIGDVVVVASVEP